MKKIILTSTLIVSTLFFTNGCTKETNETTDGKQLIPSYDQTTFCFKGLTIVEISRSKFGNGYFYERDINGSVIPCDMTKKNND